MKNVKENVVNFATAKLQTKILGILAIALAAVIGFSMMACEDEDYEKDKDEASFLMEGSSFNSYLFLNHTDYDVKVTIGSEKKTIKAHDTTSMQLSSSSPSSNTVKYSPASKVVPRYVIKGSATFEAR